MSLRHGLRSYLARLGLTAALVTTTAAPALAEWKISYETAVQALKDKDYRNAENAAIEALNETEGFGETDDRRLKTLTILSDVYRETRQWAAAIGLLEQVQAAYKTMGIDQSPDAALLWEKIGVLNHYMRDYDKAQACYEQALTIRRKKYKQNVAAIATIVTNLGELYRRKKDWAKAEELHKQAITDKENELGPDHPALVASFNNLGLVYKEQKRFDEAIALFQRAKELSLKGENAGKNADQATALHNLGDVYAAQSKHKEARQAYEAALALRQEVLGGQHPHVGETAANLANTLLALNLGEDALKRYDEAIEIYKLEYGTSDPKTMRVMANKVMALDRLKRTDEAQKLRDELKQLEEKKKQQTP